MPASPFIPPDDPSPALAEELGHIYDAAAERLRKTLLNPPGDRSAPFNRARSASLLNQINDQMAQLKKSAAAWTGPALEASVKKGLKVGVQQAKAAGIQPPRSNLVGSFDALNHRAVEVLAKDTIGDLVKGADGMQALARRTLVKVADIGVSPQQINRILAGGIIEGKPDQAIRELKQALVAVNGKKTAILCKDGITREYDSGYYAKLIATTKTRQAVVSAKHDQFRELGVSLVKIIGRISIHFCTAYLGHVYSLDGNSGQFPPLADLPQGGPPFHPQCSKSTAPFIQGLSKITAREASAAA